MLCPLPKIAGFGAILGTEAYQIKNEYAQRRRLRHIKSPPKVKFSRLERLSQTPKKWKLAFQKYKLSNSFFKMQLQNCVFPNFNLQILSSESNLRSSFTNLFNFKFSKTCWKSPKLCKRSLTHSEKKAFCLVKWDKTNDFSSIGKMKADKATKSFPTYQILAFEVW